MAHRLDATEERVAGWERGELVSVRELPAVACVLCATLHTEASGSLIIAAALAPSGAPLAFDED